MKPAGFWDWLGPFTIIFSFIVYLGISGPMEFSSCPSEGSCFLAWFSAMSGWVAAAGALVAALLALPFLSSQAKDAKRQADFAVGDAKPEFILARNRRQNTFKVTVINWNRRTVAIDNITCIDPPNYEIDRYYDPEKNITKGKRPKLVLGGWHDRSKEPKKRSINLDITFNGTIDRTFARSGSGLSVMIDYRLIGQTHEAEKTLAKAIDIETR